MSPFRCRALGVLGLIALAATPAAALEFEVGLRLGLTRSPGSLGLGAQAALEGLGIPMFRPLRIKAAGDAALGELPAEEGSDEQPAFRSLQLNLNLEYMISSPDRILRIYPIVGLGWHRLWLRDCDDAVSLQPCTARGIGLNLGGGVAYRRFAADATLGTGALPALTITGSYNFGF